MRFNLFKSQFFCIKRLQKSESGSTAIEFGILAIPFFLMIIATIETMLAFTGQQVLDNAVVSISRQLRTGEITFNAGKSTDLSESEFRDLFCDEIDMILSCSGFGSSDQKLFIDVQSVNNFTDIQVDIPKVTTATFSDLDTSGLSYSPGGAGDINVMRVYYKWSVITDLIRPYITNIRPADGSDPYYLIVATTAFRNEDYP